MGAHLSLTTKARLGKPLSSPFSSEQSQGKKDFHFSSRICYWRPWACMCLSSLLPTIDEMLRCGMPSRAGGRSPAEGQVTTEIARPGPGPVISVPRSHLPRVSVKSLVLDPGPKTLVPRSRLPRFSVPGSHTLPRDVNCSQ